MVTQEEADRLYRLKKYIPVNNIIEWKVKCQNSERIAYELRIPVVSEEDHEFILIANYSRTKKRGINYSFCLLYKSCVKIRRWDMKHHYYKKPTSHKHKWDGTNDHETYIVNDICLTDVNIALFNFLDECNIDYKNICYQTIL